MASVLFLKVFVSAFLLKVFMNIFLKHVYDKKIYYDLSYWFERRVQMKKCFKRDFHEKLTCFQTCFIMFKAWFDEYDID